MTAADQISGYRFATPDHSCAHPYLLPAVHSELATFYESVRDRRIFDLGCDPSVEGIAQAQRAFPHLQLEIGSAYDDLVARHGRFPAVVSLEVVEHVYAPRAYARALFDLVEPGGIALVSTPYHGYWKNLALAAAGRMDRHFTALWDHGHIKFWSMDTLGRLLREAGFEAVRFRRVGRFPPLAKSMIAVARKPKR